MNNKKHAELPDLNAIRLPRHRSWPTRMAVKAMLLSIGASGAGFVLAHMALPKLVETLHVMGREPSAWVLTGLRYREVLPILPAPGLILGIAALMFRPFRSLFAILAMLVSVAATIAVVAMLIGSMAPLYEIPRLG